MRSKSCGGAGASCALASGDALFRPPRSCLAGGARGAPARRRSRRASCRCARASRLHGPSHLRAAVRAAHATARLAKAGRGIRRSASQRRRAARTAFDDVAAPRAMARAAAAPCTQRASSGCAWRARSPCAGSTWRSTLRVRACAALARRCHGRWTRARNPTRVRAVARDARGGCRAAGHDSLQPVRLPARLCLCVARADGAPRADAKAAGGRGGEMSRFDDPSGTRPVEGWRPAGWASPARRRTIGVPAIIGRE